MPIWSALLSQLGNCVPTNAWKALKKLVGSDPIIIHDDAFKISTKFTAAILFFNLCLMGANQYFRSIEMDCSTSGLSRHHHSSKSSSASDDWSGNGGQAKNGNSDPAGQQHTDLNTYCWNMGTFLVAKALQPSFRGRVTYPGISSYSKLRDELIDQSYYRTVWLGILICMFISMAPYFIWKVLGSSKLRPIVSAANVEGRVAKFISTAGLNSTFSTWFIFCKLLTLLVPLISWGYLISFLGLRYTWYGLDVIGHYLRLQAKNPWPSPFDVVFPKMAKCEWSKFGYSGDVELTSAQCQLPMNNISQWCFLALWYWYALVLLVNVCSLFYFICMSCSCARGRRYKNLVSIMNQDELKKLHDEFLADAQQNDNLILKKHHHKVQLNDFINVNLSLGDWLILGLLKKNLNNSDFTEFIQELVATPNPIMELVERPTALSFTSNNVKVKGYKEDMIVWTAATANKSEVVNELNQARRQQQLRGGGRTSAAAADLVPSTSSSGPTTPSTKPMISDDDNGNDIDKNHKEIHQEQENPDCLVSKIPQGSSVVNSSEIPTTNNTVTTTTNSIYPMITEEPEDW